MSDKKLWFRAKTYGYGWFPVTWEGWLSIAVWLAGILIGMRIFARATLADPTNFWLTMYFVTFVSIWTGALVALCLKKGEKPGWRWGKSKEPKK